MGLLLNGIDPSLGGILLFGEKGTAKSTAARALANIRPGLGRFVDLPLGTTEDRLLGGLDFEQTLVTGRTQAEPGLLAQADQGVLYIDEINLLDEHLAAAILDAAGSGRVRVEREGVSRVDRARFTLIGSMNPEEGRLSSQLTDRFGLAVQIAAETDPGLRLELVRRRLDYERDPHAFGRFWLDREEKLRDCVTQARSALGGVVISWEIRRTAARFAEQAHCAGQRAEIAIIKAARALTAWEGRRQVTLDDLRRVAGMALIHRRRDLPGKSEPFKTNDVLPVKRETDPTEIEPPTESPGQGSTKTVSGGPNDQAWYEEIHRPGQSFRVATLAAGRNGGWLKDSGRRLKRETTDGTGSYVRASQERLGRGIAIDATFRAAAPHQRDRFHPALRLVVTKTDIREKVKVKTTGRLVILVVDGSGSMGSLLRMEAAKGAVLSLLAEAYQKRDRVGMVTFRGNGAELLLPPTNSVDLARQVLEELPTGGKTPLTQGLLTGLEAIDRELVRDRKLQPLIVVLTDGKPNIPFRSQADPWDECLELAPRMRRPGLTWLIVDTDHGPIQDFGLCRLLADKLGGQYLKLEEIRATGLIRLINKVKR